MSKLTTIRIRYQNGTYSEQIPVGVFAENVNWTDTITLTDVLGQVAFDTKGPIQEQIDKLLTEKVDYSKLNNYIAEWVNNNFIQVQTDTTLTQSGIPADSKTVGDQLTQIKQNINTVSRDSQSLRTDYMDFKRDVNEILTNVDTRINNSAAYVLYIDCPQGTNIHNQSIHLNAKLFRNSIDVTNVFDDSCFTWTRQSSDYYGDIYWNGNHEYGTKTITVTANDVRVNADFRCVFEYEGTTVTSG